MMFTCSECNLEYDNRFWTVCPYCSGDVDESEANYVDEKGSK